MLKCILGLIIQIKSDNDTIVSMVKSEDIKSISKIQSLGDKHNNVLCLYLQFTLFFTFQKMPCKFSDFILFPKNKIHVEA